MEPNILPAVCILMYVSLSVTGLVTLPWIMTAELFPLEYRGLNQGLIVSLAHILMFASLKTYPFLKDILGSEHGTMWLFAVLSLSSVLFVFLFFPETHKKTLIEIQDYFIHNSVFYLSAKKQNETKIIYWYLKGCLVSVCCILLSVTFYYYNYS